MAGDDAVKVVTVPMLEDNYAYLIIDTASGEAAAVDPVEAPKVVEAAEKHGCCISTVLTTHRHWDHAGGNKKMKELIPGVTIVGGSLDQVEGCTRTVQQGSQLSIGSIAVLALHTPFHTKGHICYHVSAPGSSSASVFTGDTLFVAGCGRFFEGTAAEAYTSLCKTLATLPPPTRVFCGHEYTAKNLEFAATVEPGNGAVKAKLEWARAERRKGHPTVPSSIGEELTFNPFLRLSEPSVQTFTGKSSPEEVLAELRKRKDHF